MKSAGDAPFMEAAGSRSTHPPASPVIIPTHLAAEVLRLLARALVDEARDTGARASQAAEQLLRDLYRATHAPAAPPPSSVNGTPLTPSPTVEISTSAAAASLGCSAEFVRRLCRSERLSGRRIGRAWLIDRASLDAYRYRTTEAPQ